MYKFFSLFLLHSSQRRPTKANAGQQRPTVANDGQNEGQCRSLLCTRNRAWTMVKTGPNDASGVVWALGMFLCLFLLVCFLAPDELRWPATTMTGPNDARCVIGALAMCFFFLVFF